MYSFADTNRRISLCKETILSIHGEGSSRFTRVGVLPHHSPTFQQAMKKKTSATTERVSYLLFIYTPVDFMSNPSCRSSKVEDRSRR